MAHGPAPVELFADCTSCGLEAGVVERYDPLVPACRFALPARTRCKLCGVTHEASFSREPAGPLRDVPANRCPACLEELGPRAIDDHRCAACGATAALHEVTPGATLDSPEALASALEQWAAREGWRSGRELAEAVFVDPDHASLLLRLRRGEPLEIVEEGNGRLGTPLPPIPPPLAPLPPPGSGLLPNANPDPAPVIRFLPTPPAGTVVPLEMIAPESRPSGPPPRSAPPRAIVYPLVSVIVADGVVHPAERALVDRFLESEGLAPLTEDELRVHPPEEVAHLVPEGRRETVVQLMCETAVVDGKADESERRVIRAYAAAWGVPARKVDYWMWGYESTSTSFVRQLWMKLRRLVLSARWPASDRSEEAP
ncbi:MAG: hypothetical protein JWP97_3944 [Labilithrix sp.]|nr:hypothetical protein [Labilithrix sp.]